MPSVQGCTDAWSTPGSSCVRLRLLKVEVAILEESKTETENPWLPAVLEGLVNPVICMNTEVDAAIYPEDNCIQTSFADRSLQVVVVADGSMTVH